MLSTVRYDRKNIGKQGMLGTMRHDEEEQAVMQAAIGK